MFLLTSDLQKAFAVSMANYSCDFGGSNVPLPKRLPVFRKKNSRAPLVGVQHGQNGQRYKKDAGQIEMNTDAWGRLREELITSVGKNNFVNWIEPLEFSRLENGIVTFFVPTNFMGDWVQRNFGDAILQLLAANGKDVSRVQFRVPTAPVTNALPRQKPAVPATRFSVSDDIDVPGAPLDPRFTFDKFVVGKPNELAHAAARRVAEGGDVTFNPLFLYGGVGLGKTHLMHAIAHELQAQKPELRVVYLSAEQFMYRFIQALRDKQMMDFKQIFRSVDILMVDDVQFIAGKDSTQEEFFHTFNALVDQNKQIIISADRAPGEIKHLEERIKSRLQSGLVVDLHPTDYELRLGILQQKTEQQHAQHGDVIMANGVLEFLAHRISTNVRVLGRRVDAAFCLCVARG